MPLKDPFIVFGLLSVAVSACAADKALDRAVAERLAGNDAEALASVNAYLAVHEDDAAAKLEKLRLLALTDPDRERRHIQELAGSLCRESTSRPCLEARAIAEMTDALNLYQLSPILAAEKRGDAPTALRFYEKAFEGAPGEDGLRIRYAVTLLKIPGRESEGLRLLTALSQRTDDPFISRRAQGEVTRYRVNDAEFQGRRLIRAAKTRAAGIRKLSEALLLAPTDARADGWRRDIRRALEATERKPVARVRPQAPTPTKTMTRPPETELDVLTRWAKKCREEGDDALLIYVLTEIRARTGLTPVLADELSRLYVKTGTPDKARALFEGLSDDLRLSFEWIGPYARTLADTGREDEAAALLEKTTVANPVVALLKERLRAQRVVRSAKAKAARGDWQQALKELTAANADDPSVKTLRAQWASQLTDKEAALADYRTLFDLPAYAADARLSASELLITMQRPEDAAQTLDEFINDPHTDLTLSEARRAALLYRKLNRTTAAQAVYEKGAAKAFRTYNRETALFHRDEADFFEATGLTDKALDAYRDGFVAAGLTLSRPTDNADFTRAMMTPDAEGDWVREAMRLHASLLYQQNNVIITTGLRKFHDEGTPGYSDTRGTVWMTEALMPAFGGTLTLRNDVVRYDMGRITPGEWEAMTGTCFSGGCNPGNGFTKDVGNSLSLAWTDGTYAFDIGTTPIGFHYVDPVGAAAVNFSLGPFSVTTEIYRRAKDASLLAYGGQRDPATGLWWGGVRRTGASLSTSVDQGGTFGFWSKVSWEAVTGRNVARNSDWQVMMSPYVRLVNHPNHELSASLFTMLWGFEKDLSGYTFGQGGYYSPQTYVGFTASVTDTGRTENWAWKASVAANRSYAKTEGRPRYFLTNRIPAWQRDEMSDIDSVSDTDSEWSNGWSAAGALERRLGSHVSLGVAAGMSKAPDYDYQWGLLYLRWYQKPWRGSLPMPVPVLTPYSAR